MKKLYLIFILSLLISASGCTGQGDSGGGSNSSDGSNATDPNGKGSKGVEEDKGGKGRKDRVQYLEARADVLKGKLSKEEAFKKNCNVCSDEFISDYIRVKTVALQEKDRIQIKFDELSERKDAKQLTADDFDSISKMALNLKQILLDTRAHYKDVSCSVSGEVKDSMIDGDWINVNTDLGERIDLIGYYFKELAKEAKAAGIGYEYLEDSKALKTMLSNKSPYKKSPFRPQDTNFCSDAFMSDFKRVTEAALYERTQIESEMDKLSESEKGLTKMEPKMFSSLRKRGENLRQIFADTKDHYGKVKCFGVLGENVPGRIIDVEAELSEEIQKLNEHLKQLEEHVSKL